MWDARDEWLLTLAHAASRCRARCPWSKLPCRAPAMRGKPVCRLHAGKGGGPMGLRNLLGRPIRGRGEGGKASCAGDRMLTPASPATRVGYSAKSALGPLEEPMNSSPLLGHRNASRRTRSIFSSDELPCGRYGGPNVAPSVLTWTENHSPGKPLQLISWQYVSGKCLFGHLTETATINEIVAAARGVWRRCPFRSSKAPLPAQRRRQAVPWI
jgi:hypothetical protein